MIRFLIILGLIYLAYRTLRSWMLPGGTSKTNVSREKTAGEIDDIMVKDPYCEIYFPKRKGFPLNSNGETLYFCSTECRDKFIAKDSKNDA